MVYATVGRGDLSLAPDEVRVVVFLWVLFVGLSLIFAAEVFGVVIRISSGGIRRRSPWSPDLFLRWEEIESVTYNPGMMWFVARGRPGKVRVHQYLSGVRDFLRAVRENVPPEKRTGIAGWVSAS